MIMGTCLRMRRRQTAKLLHDHFQVEGCGRELCALTTYHQRCRICEVHIKLPSFMRHGTQQRFCQQCGRCHQLSAFDSGKRSCRAQLQKHNARCVGLSFQCCVPVSTGSTWLEGLQARLLHAHIIHTERTSVTGHVPQLCRRRKLANKKAQQAEADSPRNGRGGARADADDGDESPTARRPARRQKAMNLNAPGAVSELAFAAEQQQQQQHHQQQQQQRLAALGGAAAAAAAKPPVGLGPLGAGLPHSQAEFLRSLAPVYAHELETASKPAFGLPSAQVHFHCTCWTSAMQDMSLCDGHCSLYIAGVLHGCDCMFQVAIRWWCRTTRRHTALAVLVSSGARTGWRGGCTAAPP